MAFTHTSILTLDDVAKALGIKYGLVAYHARCGHLKANCWLGRFFVTAEDFETFKADRAAGKFSKRGRKAKR
jgi:hypothetical protein